MRNTKRYTLCIFVLSITGIAFGFSQNKNNSLARHYDVGLPELIRIYKNGELWRNKNDTSRNKKIILSEVTVTGAKGIQEIGLSNLKQENGFRGKTGDKMAVYIPHPATSIRYKVEAITVTLRTPHSYDAKFEQGALKMQLCEAINSNHQPGAALLSKALIIQPQEKRKAHGGKMEITLTNTIDLPDSGLFVVAEWEYDRIGKDLASGITRSASLAANLSLQESYTWSSVGDMKQTWQREGEKNSLSEAQPLFKGRIFNALMGVKVKEEE
jgi:hypothetical protein